MCAFEITPVSYSKLSSEGGAFILKFTYPIFIIISTHLVVTSPPKPAYLKGNTFGKQEFAKSYELKH